MPLYKDLATYDIRFMRFSVHLSGGLELVDAFWESRGLDRAEERLVFAKYTRRNVPHTAYIAWGRAHAACADLFLALCATAPSKILPNRGQRQSLLTAESFREFFDLVRVQDVALGIKAEYGYPTPHHMKPLSRPDKSIRISSLSFEVLDGEGKLVMTVDTSRSKDEWITTMDPAGRLHFLPKPVEDDFFDAPYNTARALGAILRREEQ